MDHSSLITAYFVAGSPGSYHDARVFRRTQLPEKLEAIPNDRHLLGDSGYPASLGLLTPFPDTGNLTAAQKHFNFQHSSTRMIVENANARLKNKWRRLKFITTHSTTRACDIIRSCVVLHNFLLRHDSTLCYSDEPYMFDMPSLDSANDKRHHIITVLQQ